MARALTWAWGAFPQELTDESVCPTLACLDGAGAFACHRQAGRPVLHATWQAMGPPHLVHWGRRKSPK